VPFAAVPTTLLAQVDAGLGGKSGLNLDLVKNQIGVVRQPRLVVADPAFLASLSERSFRSGLGELAKCALLAGGELHALVTRGAHRVLARDPAALEQAIGLALRYKAGVVSRDPLDAGERALLNAGHTIGHALESEALRRGIELPHGEAVAAGLVVEARAHERADPACVRAVLDALALPADPPFQIEAGAARESLQRDKKQRNGSVRLPVIVGPGDVAIHDVAIERLLDALAR
jgi:3-dehydroquinate synthetase